MGNYLETLKNISKDKKKEKLIYILVLCTVLFIAISYIFNGESNKKTKDNIINNNVNQIDITDSMESKLSKILSEISGIGEVSVMITYNDDGKVNPVYNTKEEDKEGEKTSDKTVVYNEESSGKKVLIESTEMPKVAGVIVVASSANNLEVKTKIAQAVSAITNIPVHKVQVFEKEG